MSAEDIMRKGFMGIVSVWMLGGCSIKEAPPLTLYTFPSPVVKEERKAPLYDKVIKISMPYSLKQPLSYKMAYSYSSNEQGYYQNSQWTNNVGKMLQGYLIEVLQQDRLYKAVLPYESSVPEDQRLESIVYDFSHHVKGRSSYAVVSIEFALIDMHSGKLIKRRRFDYKESTPTVDAKGYVVATNKILKKLSWDLLRWLKDNTK
jgi:cholesterol transport system auxiliary component